MPVVDVNTVRLDDLLELVDERLPRSFNTQHTINLNHVIAVSFVAVNLEMREAFAQVGAVSLENDVFVVLFAFFFDLVFDPGRVDSAFGGFDSFDVLDAADEDVAEVLLDLEEEGVVFVLAGVLAGFEVGG